MILNTIKSIDRSFYQELKTDLPITSNVQQREPPLPVITRDLYPKVLQGRLKILLWKFVSVPSKSFKEVPPWNYDLRELQL